MTKNWSNSILLIVSFRMIPHMTIVLAKTNFRFEGLKGLIRASIGGQEGQNAQNIISFISPTRKLSNDTPYAYSTSKNEIPSFRAIRGQ